DDRPTQKIWRSWRSFFSDDLWGPREKSVPADERETRDARAHAGDERGARLVARRRREIDHAARDERGNAETHRNRREVAGGAGVVAQVEAPLLAQVLVDRVARL